MTVPLLELSFSRFFSLRFFLFLLSSSTRTSSRILNKLSSPFGHSVNQSHSLLFLLLFRVCLIDLQLLQRSLSGTWLCDCKSTIFFICDFSLFLSMFGIGTAPVVLPMSIPPLNDEIFIAGTSQTQMVFRPSLLISF